MGSDCQFWGPVRSVLGREGKGWEDPQPHHFLPPQLLPLGVKVMILSCGRQQILAGELTNGSLLSFLLYQVDVWHHVCVSEGPTPAPALPSCSVSGSWGLLISLNGAGRNVRCHLILSNVIQIQEYVIAVK